jgi:DNA topoisomerase-1
VNNPATCTANYSLPAAGFIEPAPEFLCGTCKVPRVKIIFRGQRPDLYCINPECPEHHKAFRIGTCPSCGLPLAIRYSFRGNRFVGCTGYPNCRVTYPLPQRGKLEKEQPPCPVCRAPIVTAIEAGRPPWTLCINPECPTRNKDKKAAKGAGAAGAKTKKAAPKSPARRRKAPAAPPPTEPPTAPAAPAAEPAPVAEVEPPPPKRRPAKAPAKRRSKAADPGAPLGP